MQERTSVPPVHPDECMSTAPPNAPSSPVRWIDGQAIGVLLRLAFSGPPCVPARLADSAGFRRAAAKKRASACGCGDAGRYSTQNSCSASRIAWIMAYYQDTFSIIIRQNAQPGAPNTHSRDYWQQVGSTPSKRRCAREIPRAHLRFREVVCGPLGQRGGHASRAARMNATPSPCSRGLRTHHSSRAPYAAFSSCSSWVRA